MHPSSSYFYCCTSSGITCGWFVGNYMTNLPNRDDRRLSMGPIIHAHGGGGGDVLHPSPMGEQFSQRRFGKLNTNFSGYDVPNFCNQCMFLTVTQNNEVPTRPTRRTYEPNGHFCRSRPQDHVQSLSLSKSILQYLLFAKSWTSCFKPFHDFSRNIQSTVYALRNYVSTVHYTRFFGKSAFSAVAPIIMMACVCYMPTT